MENISTELHEALSSLDIKEPYVLAWTLARGLATHSTMPTGTRAKYPP